MVSLFFLKALYKSATYTARSFCTVGHRCDLRRLTPLSIFQEHRLKERQRTQRHFFFHPGAQSQSDMEQQ